MKKQSSHTKRIESKSDRRHLKQTDFARTLTDALRNKDNGSNKGKKRNLVLKNTSSSTGKWKTILNKVNSKFRKDKKEKLKKIKKIQEEISNQRLEAHKRESIRAKEINISEKTKMNIQDTSGYFDNEEYGLSDT